MTGLARDCASCFIFCHAVASKFSSFSKPKLRWLLGSVYWWTEDTALENRLAAIADRDGWRATRDAHEERNPLIDFARLSPTDIARVWIAQNQCADKDRDQNWSALRDYESELRVQDPGRALAIILEVLKIEGPKKAAAKKAPAVGEEG